MKFTHHTQPRHRAPSSLNLVAFHFPASALIAVALFIESERHCCSFFSFTVSVSASEAAITMQITGSPAAKAVIAAELLASDA